MAASQYLLPDFVENQTLLPPQYLNVFFGKRTTQACQKCKVSEASGSKSSLVKTVCCFGRTKTL